VIRHLPSARRQLVWTCAIAFAVFNAVFDVAILLAIDEYVAAAARAAREGTFIRVQDRLGIAARQGLMLALAASCLVLAAGAVRIRKARRRTPGT
jgi:hypothetical protein